MNSALGMMQKHAWIPGTSWHTLDLNRRSTAPLAQSLQVPGFLVLPLSLCTWHDVRIVPGFQAPFFKNDLLKLSGVLECLAPGSTVQQFFALLKAARMKL